MDSPAARTMQVLRRDKPHLALLVCLVSVVVSRNGLASALSVDTRAHPGQSVAPSSGQQQGQPHQQQSPTTTTEISTANTRAQDTRRPIWVLAHMVNSIRELEYRLGLGANAIEVDVKFSHEGVPVQTYHGPPCDCWRHCHQQENFNDYLDFVRRVSIDTQDGIGRNLTILFLDLKLDPLDQQAKERAGQELAKSVLTYLFVIDKEPAQSSYAAKRAQGAQPFHLILSINHVSDIDLVRNFIYTLEMNNSSHLLNNEIGFDVGMNDDLQQIESMWRRFSATMGVLKLNLWQGDGYTNCLSPFYNLERLSKALSKRDNSPLQPTVTYPMKVYHWTIDLHDRMRESLLMGVDAVMSNHPERMLAILQEPEMAHDFRLATRLDQPFKRLSRRLAGRSGETARYQRSAHSPGGGLLSQLVDVLTSWWSYMREIPFLSYPTTLVASSRLSALSTTVRRRYSTSTPKPILTAGPATESNSTFLARGQEQLPERGPESSPSNSSSSRQASAEFEPKWYTKVASNVMVSAMKQALPSHSSVPAPSAAARSAA